MTLGHSRHPFCLIRRRMATRMSNQEMSQEKRSDRDLEPAIRGLRIGRRGGGCDVQPPKMTSR
jgi:hypothetical protein